jgi:hypothetical protein
MRPVGLWGRELQAAPMKSMRNPAADLLRSSSRRQLPPDQQGGMVFVAHCGLKLAA